MYRARVPATTSSGSDGTDYWLVSARAPGHPWWITAVIPVEAALARHHLAQLAMDNGDLVETERIGFAEVLGRFGGDRMHESRVACARRAPTQVNDFR